MNFTFSQQEKYLTSEHIVLATRHRVISSMTFRIHNSFVLVIIYRCITNSQSGQFPVGLMAQLVEHCTGITSVMV